ncbi:MAG: nitroreductase family protein [Candidatus Thermoplasmatota archaeon]|nr:nitroreductase family protein [Candidatus Thermoplasmatota archaeon]
MELWSAMSKRRSVRNFSILPPSDAMIEKLLEAARAAPSAGGLGSRKVFVVKAESKRRALADACHGQEFVAQAHVVLLFCADLDRITPYGDRGRNLYCIQDVAASVQNVLLRAVDIGLGACWVGAFDEGTVSEIIGLKEGIRPLALVPVGYEA